MYNDVVKHTYTHTESTIMDTIRINILYEIGYTVFEIADATGDNVEAIYTYIHGEALYNEA